ncbi:glycosyltransferase involved in cell wall biosynthesis [Sphingomonas sp. F9_3S_D5_B_2]
MMDEPGTVGRKKVLFLVNSLAGGGAERVMATLLTNSREWVERHQVALAVLDDDARSFTLPDWLDVRQLDCRHGTWASISAVARVVSDFDPDVTVSFLTRSNIASGLVMMRRRRPWIISERTSTSAHLGNGGRQLVTKALIRFIYPRASRVIAVSAGVAAKLCSSYGVRPDRVEIISNPVDMAAIAAAAQAPNDISEGEPYILAIGRLVSVKNYALLIHAFAVSGLTCRLVIAGDGPERDALKVFAAQLGVADRVIFPGWLTNPYPALRHASVFALSSNVEGFPNALVEALALGIPAVATNCNDGPAEILAGSTVESVAGVTVAEAGILAPVRDVQSYARALQLAFDERVRSQLMNAGPRRAMDYSAPGAAARYWAVIERELEKASAAPRT